MYLLDTNTCIQLWQRKNGRVNTRFEACKPSEVALCSIVKAELLFGALKSQNSISNMQLLNRWFLPMHSYLFDDAAALDYADIRHDLTTRGQVIGANDFMIAAIARAHNLTLVTNNTSEFSRVKNLSIEDWEL